MSAKQMSIGRFGFIALATLLVGCGLPFQVKPVDLASELSSQQDAGGGPTAKACPATTAGQTVLRRLNRHELGNSLNDLLGLNLDLTVDFPADTSSADGFDNNGDFLSTSPEFVHAAAAAAERAVTAALAKQGSPFLNCPQSTAAETEGCVQKLLGAFARLAFRRPVSTAETETLLGFYRNARALGATFNDAMAFSLQRILIAPDFLYRTSFGLGPKEAAGSALSPHEFATRLAFFLWNSPPDAALLAAADQNKLSGADDVKTQIKRMLSDRKAQRFVRSFAGQWLGLRHLESSTGITRAGLTDGLRQAMKTETEMFFSAILSEDRSAMDLISGDFTFVNETLAPVYGINGVTGAGFQRVSLTGLPRRGVLTQASFLTLTSSPEVTKPTGRGFRILSDITCTPPPPFPDNADITPLPENADPNLTIRQRMQAHASSPRCIGCHSEMDPVGFGFESFDMIGRWRTTYPNGLPIDSSGTLRQKSFADTEALLAIIEQDRTFKSCITKKMMTYAVGRALTTGEACLVEQIGAARVQPGQSFSDFVFSIVMSVPFRYNNTDSKVTYVQ